MTDKADLKNGSTTVFAKSRAFWRVHTILDESPIFSLKIEQNHSSPITKFITDLTNTLFLEEGHSEDVKGICRKTTHSNAIAAALVCAQ